VTQTSTLRSTSPSV